MCDTLLVGVVSIVAGRKKAIENDPYNSGFSRGLKCETLGWDFLSREMIQE